MTRSEADFLLEINADLPDGVNWKEGAITYLRELVDDGGEEKNWFHFVKPFVGGPDFGPFWVDVFQFLDVVHKLDLAPNSRIIDVGTGPGWTLHWLAKLGHHVTGLDISKELLDVAERRLQADAFHPYLDRPFDVRFALHDIEEAPLDHDRPYDVALFESTLHHFYNPVAALRNTASCLARDGLVAIIEAAAPPNDSVWHRANVDLMQRYRTIERPYTRTQLYDMLELAGFPFADFYRPLNGLFRQDADALQPLASELTWSDNINIVIASRTKEGLERISPGAEPLSRTRQGWSPVEGFSLAETRPDGTRYRWCGTRGTLRCHTPGSHELRVRTHDLGRRQQQAVYALVDDVVVDRVALTRDRPSGLLRVRTGGAGVVELHSDRAFSPSWTGSGDTRVLSFQLDLP